jgi:hypothetical protein
MVNDRQPLPPYKDLLYYSIGLTILSMGLLIYYFMDNVSINYLATSIVLMFVFGVFTFMVWDTRCPHCKWSFFKREVKEWEENVPLSKHPYTYYSRVYKFHDGFRENDPDSAKTIDRYREGTKKYFVCKKCEYGSDKEWFEDKIKWLGEEPKKEIIIKKSRNDIP